MIYISKDTELTIEVLQKLIGKFLLNTRPKLKKRKDYYDGKHAILSKSYADESKECNHVVTNYCKIITDTYNGYICGKPVSYTSNQDITEVQDCINYNDGASADVRFCKNALVHGVAFELEWLDKFAQVRYAQTSPLDSFAIYDNTLDSELLYFVRWYEADTVNESDLHYLEVYSAEWKRVYCMHGVGGSLKFIEEEKHYFGDVPVSVFYLNDSEENIFDCIIPLNDAYNELQSSEIDDFNAWVDAYLVLVGVDADTEDIAAMKSNRALVLPEGASATWLTKNANDTQIVNMMDNIKQNIFKVTACPDMADDTFLAQSGTALAYKLVGFENVASGIVASFTKAIQRRIELICNVLEVKGGETVWRDIQIHFTRNLPVNLSEVVQLVNALKGSVSDATLISQLPFITDVQAELEAISEQKRANIALYDFGANNNEGEEETV